MNERRAERTFGRSGRWTWLAATMMALAATACGGGDDGASGAAGAAGAGGGGGGQTGGTTGVLEVKAHWDGTVPAGTELKVAVFTCPFSMPPKRYFTEPVEVSTGEATATDDKVSVGDWCVMAYYDLDPSDGLAPVQGLDPVNATGKENDKGSIPVVIQGGKTTTISMELKVAGK